VSGRQKMVKKYKRPYRFSMTVGQYAVDDIFTNVGSSSLCGENNILFHPE
jgi:hypothetical protein